MKIKLALLAVLTLISLQALLSQSKNEKEERIKRSDFPEKIQNIIKSLPKECKRLKFYKETDGTKKSYEVKFKYKKQHYSLEFSEKGMIEDIEVLTKLNDIKLLIKKQIKIYFKQSFDKHKLIKIQKQYVYSKEIKPSQFIIDVLNKKAKATINFEIIAEVKSKKTREIREFTFNNNGQFLRDRTLNLTSYEHDLY